jgi:hypothetical protein
MFFLTAGLLPFGKATLHTPTFISIVKYQAAFFFHPIHHDDGD